MKRFYLAGYEPALWGLLAVAVIAVLAFVGYLLWFWHGLPF